MNDVVQREKVKALAENVQKLLTLHEEKHKTMRQLLEACLTELEGKTASSRRKELLTALKEVLEHA